MQHANPNTAYNNERGVRQTGAGMTYGESPASGPAPTTAGHHKHDFINKLDPSVDSTRDREPLRTSHNNNIPEGTYGPHKSRLANALDPRVDSDLDRTRGMDQRTGHPLPGNPPHVSGGPAAMPPTMHGGASGVHGHHYNNYNGGNNVPEGTYGPHSSRIANTLDPRVDSDRDRGYNSNSGGGYSAGTSAGVPGAGGYGTHPSAGPGGMFGSTRHAGVGATAANANLPGPAPNTAGPHRSDLLNKLDPAVDSKGTGYQNQRRGM